MLPFLNKNKRVAGVIISHRKPDEVPPSEQPEQEDDNAALEACAADLIQAVSANNIKGVASALKAAFEICESYEDDSDKNDFHSQNIKAAEEQE